ncbi:hypothetical protein Tco_1359400 [Tanacetum coccineum]
MEDEIEVFDAKITIRSSLSFITDVKNKLEEPRNDKNNTLFRAIIFGKWLDLPSFANDNLLFNYFFQHQASADSIIDCPLLLIIFVDELWFAIIDHDAVRVCLLLVATIVFMGREPRTLNVVPRKNKRDSKKNKEIVLEPPKKKKKVDNSSKKKKKVEEEAQKKMITYNLYGFVWSLKKKDPTVIPHGISWSIIGNFHKGDYSCLFAQWSNPISTFGPSDDKSVQQWCIRSFDYFSNRDGSVLRDGVGEVLAEVLEP